MMNIPGKIARQGPSFGIKCRVCNNDISQEKPRVDLFRAKSPREGVLKYLQRFFRLTSCMKTLDIQGTYIDRVN